MDLVPALSGGVGGVRISKARMVLVEKESKLVGMRFEALSVRHEWGIIIIIRAVRLACDDWLVRRLMLLLDHHNCRAICSSPQNSVVHFKQSAEHGASNFGITIISVHTAECRCAITNPGPPPHPPPLPPPPAATIMMITTSNSGQFQPLHS